MFGGVLIHAVLFRLGLRIFFRAVQRGVGDYAGYRDGMSDMISELDGIALDLPSGAFCGSKLVLIGIVAFLKATRERARFLVCSFCCVLRSGYYGRIDITSSCAVMNSPPSGRSW
jgi:hypothetical protein